MIRWMLSLQLLTLINTIDATLFGQRFYESTLNSRLSLANNHIKNLLVPFNVTRTPGSTESLKVQNFIEDHFENLENDWLFEPNQFFSNGFNFTNMVFTLGHNASSYLVLAAHYDSKLVPPGFIGAIDSAASCSILLYIAEFIDNFYTEFQSVEQTSFLTESTGLKIVFFDGEEAINEWSVDDSIYGAKNLAALWEEDGTLPKLESLILLDLLGSVEDVKVPSYFARSSTEYQMLLAIEAENQNILPYKHTLFDNLDKRFQDYDGILIEDDHLPFLAYGIPVLHLIPVPFPSCWHTLNDTFDNLDEPKIQNWALLLCEFLSLRMRMSLRDPF
ncbi:LANO_0G14906g1_1 [Lachancea nothofagi CBS 11611]|uniref:Peptide hydrolase n=1 Tax=Lachancea nothofagi CBS 11611 TaxID=1266666 RepID=A0A1G4KKE3_9SACH|nr:LANO_0G14906g1_1 [Lachancea nothofagi CBS 11611]